MTKIAIIAVGGANFYSICVVLERLGIQYELTTTGSVIEASDGAILPGVGSAAYAMNTLVEYKLVDVIRNYKKPLLGICLGMQILYEFSEEGDVDCLGILPGKVVKFDTSNELIVPHMGWNNLSLEKSSVLLNQIDLACDFYFVHSYYVGLNELSVASCDYGVQFTAISQNKNFFAVQFHPEKSGLVGQQLLKNFVEVAIKYRDNLSSN